MECYKHNRCKNAANCPRNYETFDGFCTSFERARFSQYDCSVEKYEKVKKKKAKKL